MTAESSQPLMGSVKYRDGLDFRKVLNDSLNVFFRDALRVALTDPSQALHFVRTLNWQRRASAVRTRWKEQGVAVPPILIFSITSRCNLHCKGCYHRALRPDDTTEMDAAKMRSVIAEARELGVSFVMIAGGEPLMRPEILDISGDFPEITFLVFSNGLLISDDIASRLARQRNFVPVLSLEGYEGDTDGRRGAGVYQHLKQTVARLKSRGIFWSVSLTVTRHNFDTLMGEAFIKGLVTEGCKLFFFVEYTPVSKETEDWLLSAEQRTELIKIRDGLRKRYTALFVAIPGDEEEIGGCLSAGRGFIHVSATGDVEPCPFAPYSDCNLNHVSLKDALKSEFLKKIRDGHNRLNEAEGGCALWVERAWVQSLLHGGVERPGTAGE